MDATTGKSFIAEVPRTGRNFHTPISSDSTISISCLYPISRWRLCDSSLADGKKPIEIEEAAWLLFNVCEGLKFTHANKIIHGT